MLQRRRCNPARKYKKYSWLYLSDINVPSMMFPLLLRHTSSLPLRELGSSVQSSLGAPPN